MIALLICLVAMGLLLFVVTYFQRRNKTEETEITVQIDEECCGAHVVCDKDTLLISDNKITYYDDEDLDELANIAPKDMNETQVQQLSEVFFTLKESDVSGWLRSLQQRNIQLPITLREEALMIVSERRAV